MLSNGSKVTRNLKVLCFIFAICFPHHSSEAASFDGCDHTFNIKPGYSYLESPDYPYFYPPNTSCRYKFIAPTGYNITVTCTIKLPKGPNGCSTEKFYLARDGDKYLRDSEDFCGSGTFKRTSDFDSVVMAYISRGGRGNFQCQLNAKPQPYDCGWSVNTKITNGQEASINEYPSMVALKDKTSPMVIKPAYCSAVIISHIYMLTAAHCIGIQPTPRNIEAWVGRHNIQSRTDTKYAAVYDISAIHIHPQYMKESTNHDIALLKTTKVIKFSKGVGPICLPPPSNANNAFLYEMVDVIGWGFTKFAGSPSPTLQKVTLMVTDYETCSKAFGSQDPIYPTHICTYDFTGKKKDSCQFDSGGPVILRKNRQYLVGIISFGQLCSVGEKSISVNTRITSHLRWISAYT